MVHKIVLGNKKGGVAKTVNSVMIATTLADKGYKVLVCDLDPQTDATDLLTRSYFRQNGVDIPFRDTMMNAISQGDLETCMLQLKENLFLLPSFTDIRFYSQFLFDLYPSTLPDYRVKHMEYFGKLLSRFEDEFDYIIFDITPTIDTIYADSAFYASNKVLITLQPQPKSVKGVKMFFEHVQHLYDTHPDIDFDLIGILPVMVNKASRIESDMLEEAYETFGDQSFFDNMLYLRERIKGYDRDGIPDMQSEEVSRNPHDKGIKESYELVVNELIERVGD